jgi:hypothetical protein
MKLANMAKWRERETERKEKRKGPLHGDDEDLAPEAYAEQFVNPVRKNFGKFVGLMDTADVWTSPLACQQM